MEYQALNWGLKQFCFQFQQVKLCYLPQDNNLQKKLDEEQKLYFGKEEFQNQFQLQILQEKELQLCLCLL